MQEKQFPTLLHSFSYAIGSGLGWLLAVVILAAINERLKYSQIPKPLQGNGIAYIITGLMGIGFMAFFGL